MRFVNVLFIVSVFVTTRGVSEASNDSLFQKRNQISIGTNGFYLPKFKDYSISGFNLDEFYSYRFFINNASYLRKVDELYDFKFSYDGMKSKLYKIIIDPSDMQNGTYTKFVTMHIFSAGLLKSFSTDFIKCLTLETQTGVSFQYRFGHERLLWHLGLRRPLNGPGIKLSISENLVYKKRYILGINADFHAFYQPDREFQMKDHNYFMSNALYLGVKF